MNKEIECPDCGGTGIIVDQVQVCCNNPTQYGSCCGGGVIEYEQKQCVRCGATGVIDPSTITDKS